MSKRYKNIHTNVVYRDLLKKGRRFLVEVNDDNYHLPLTTKEFELLDRTGKVVLDNWGDVHLEIIR